MAAAGVSGASTAQGKPTGMKTMLWWAGLIIAVALGVLLWFGPAIPHLAPIAQKGLALMVPTVLMWILRTADEAVVGLIFIVAVIGLKVMPADKFLVDWTGANIWFAFSAFILGAVITKAGLIRRVAYGLLMRVPNRYMALTGVIFVVQAVFTFLGVAGSFARIALLYPLVFEIADASGLSRESNGFKGLAIAVMAAGEPAMLLSYTGFWLNPFAMTLSGHKFLYTDWLRLFTVPALALMIVTWLAVHVVFRHKEPLRIPREELKKRLQEMGPFFRSKLEVRTSFYLLLVLILWLTDSYHHIEPGWIALLGVAVMMMPRIGVIDLHAGLSSVKWPIILFLGAAFGLGKMVGALGISKWMGALLLPHTAPASEAGLALLVSYAAIGLHFVTGDVASSMSVTIPPLTQYAASLGFNTAIIGFIAYVASWEQYIFPFQNAGVLMAYGYGCFTLKDLVKFGLVLTVVIPLAVVLFGLPYWNLIGVMH